MTTQDKSTWIVLWHPRNTQNIAPIGPFETREQAAGWVDRHLSNVPNDRVQVRRLFGPGVESIALPTVIDECPNDNNLDFIDIRAFLARNLKGGTDGS